MRFRVDCTGVNASRPPGEPLLNEPWVGPKNANEKLEKLNGATRIRQVAYQESVLFHSAVSVLRNGLRAKDGLGACVHGDLSVFAVGGPREQRRFPGEI